MSLSRAVTGSRSIHVEAAIIYITGRMGQIHEENNLILEKRRDAVDVKREKMVENHARRELERQLNITRYGSLALNLTPRSLYPYPRTYVYSTFFRNSSLFPQNFVNVRYG